MIQFAISKGFNVRSTTFPHKDIHKETWYSTDSKTANQIDHVFISNKFRSAITDIRALRGPDIGSDHNLLKINFKVKLRVKTEKKYNEKRKIVNIFQNSKWKQTYEPFDYRRSASSFSPLFPSQYSNPILGFKTECWPHNINPHIKYGT